MLDDEFNKRQVNLLRELASRADPFIKKRLLDLTRRYERPARTPLPLPTINGSEVVYRRNGATRSDAD
jgi:hypothetical protein